VNLPESLLVLENIFVALLALLGAEANGICLLMFVRFAVPLIEEKNVLP
jgi:hypothetical protein